MNRIQIVLIATVVVLAQTALADPPCRILEAAEIRSRTEVLVTGVVTQVRQTDVGTERTISTEIRVTRISGRLRSQLRGARVLTTTQTCSLAGPSPGEPPEQAIWSQRRGCDLLPPPVRGARVNLRLERDTDTPNRWKEVSATADCPTVFQRSWDRPVPAP